MEHWYWRCSVPVMAVAVVVLAVAAEANPESKNTTNVIQMFPLNTAEATKETVNIINENEKSNESDNITATEETASYLNDTKKSNMTVIPLRREVPVAKLNESKESDQNGEWISDPNEQECDPSNRCVDEKETFIACLRVPGTDSLALSLLLENNNTGSLEIKIVAPSFVNLEQSQIQLKAKEHKLVKVLLADSADDTTILLVSEGSSCSLNLRNTLVLESPRTSSRFIQFLTRFTIFCFVLAAMILLALAYLFVKFRRSQPEVGFKYQRQDFELSVSSGGPFSENWDDCADGWHDEEAPLTPSKPISKPLYKGLNSRKISKEVWRTDT